MSGKGYSGLTIYAIHRFRQEGMSLLDIERCTGKSRKEIKEILRIPMEMRGKKKQPHKVLEWFRKKLGEVRKDGRRKIH